MLGITVGAKVVGSDEGIVVESNVDAVGFIVGISVGM